MSVDLSSTNNNVTTTTIFNLINIHFIIATRNHLLTRLRTDKQFEQSPGIINLLPLTQIKALVILDSKPLPNNVASKVFCSIFFVFLKKTPVTFQMKCQNLNVKILA